RLQPARQRHLLGEPQILGLGQTHRHAVPFKLRGDHPSLSLERKVSPLARAPLDEPDETTRAVAAPLTRAAVAVVEIPRSIRFARRAGPQQDQAVGAHTAMPIAEARNLVAGQLDAL